MKRLIVLLAVLSLSAVAKDAKPYNMTLTVVSVKTLPIASGARSSSQTDCQMLGNDISCNTTDTSFSGIHGVSYAILAKASDGNTYLFGCDAQWRWSHCIGLKPEEFNARLDGGALVVQYRDNKGKAKECKYHILSMEKTPQ